MILFNIMSREYMVFDRSGCSERIIRLLHDRDFSISAFENDESEIQENGFMEAMALGVGALKNAKLSMLPPLLEEELSWGSSSSQVAASMADEKQQQEEEKVEMADDEESNCYCGEDLDEVDALLNLEDTLVDTADSMDAVSDHRSQRIGETFKMLRDLVGGDWMDTVHVLDEAIQRVKKLQMDLKNLNCNRDI